MENKIRTIIAQILKVSPDEVEPDMVIGDLDEWDSMHHIMILAALEKEFGIKFDKSDLSELEDVSDIIALVKEESGLC